MQKNAIIIKFTKMDVHPFSEATNHVNILHVAEKMMMTIANPNQTIGASID